MKAVIIFEVKNKKEFERLKEAHKLPDEKWWLLLNKYDICNVIKEVIE